MTSSQSKAIGQILLDNGADPNLTDINSRPPLLWVSDDARSLLRGRSKPSIVLLRRPSVGFMLTCSLQWRHHFQAAYHNRAKISKLFVENGADLTATDSRGRGVLHLCSRIKDTRCFKLYLKMLNEKHPIVTDEESGEQIDQVGTRTTLLPEGVLD